MDEAVKKRDQKWSSEFDRDVAFVLPHRSRSLHSKSYQFYIKNALFSDNLRLPITVRVPDIKE